MTHFSSRKVRHGKTHDVKESPQFFICIMDIGVARLGFGSVENDTSSLLAL